MSTNKHIIFEHRECLSEDTLQRYANGSLTAKEKHVVEKHTMGCDLCADALEGVLNMKDPSKLKSIVADLNKKILERAGRKPIVLWMDTRVRVAVAAGLVLLVGFFFLFNNDLKDTTTTVSDNLVKENNENNAPSGLTEKKDSFKMSNELTVDDRKDEKPVETPSKSKDPVALSKNSEGTGGTTYLWTTTPEKTVTGEDRSIITMKDLESERDEDLQQKTKVGEKKPESLKGGIDDITGKQDGNTNGGKDNDGQLKKSGGENGDAKTNSDEFINIPKDDKKIVVTDKVVSKGPPPVDEQEKYRSKDQSKKEEQNRKEKDKEEPKKKSQVDGSNKNDTYYGAPQTTTQQPVNTVVVTENNPVVNNQGNVTVTDPPSPNTLSQPDLDKGYHVAQDSTSSKVSVDMILVQGKKKYDAKEYDAALKLFEQVLLYDGSNREALYYSGASYLAKNDADKAIASYDKVIAMGKGLLYDDARYDKSLALMKKNKNEEAKKILNDLIKEGSTYKSKAMDLEKK